MISVFVSLHDPVVPRLQGLVAGAAEPSLRRHGSSALPLGGRNVASSRWSLGGRSANCAGFGGVGVRSSHEFRQFCFRPVLSP